MLLPFGPDMVQRACRARCLDRGTYTQHLLRMVVELGADIKVTFTLLCNFITHGGILSPMSIISFGELLIDFVSNTRDVAVGEAPGFIKAPGGAPANVAVGLAKLGIPSVFMSQVGDDPFGHHLAAVLQSHGVDISAVRFSQQALTMLAFVSVEASGERSFVFYRKPSADMLMTEADLDKAMIANGKIFHFGSITLIDEPVRSTTLAAVLHAQEQGLTISYDPNLREVLWPDLEIARAGIQQGLIYANIVKLSEEELTFLTGESDLEAGVQKIWRDQTQLVAVTRGAAGCMAFTMRDRWDIPGYAVEVEDTIGAGDGFVAGLLAGIYQVGDSWLDTDLTPILQRANAVGALTTTRQGGIPALPMAAAVDDFLKSVR